MTRQFHLMLATLVSALVSANLARAKMDVLASRQGAEVGAKPCRCENQPRPSVLVTPERLALVRKEVLSGQGERAAIYAQHIKVNADRWLHRAITIPDVGGWMHDFFCADGTMLELPSDQQFDPRLPSRCPTCGKTYLNGKIIAARRYFEHTWLADAARGLALAYAIEGKEEYARKSAEILTQYADAYPHRLGSPQGGGFQSISLIEAVDLIPMVEGYDLVCETMTAAQRAHVERDLFWPAAQSLTKAGGLEGNWGSWHLSAVGVIGYATRHQRFIDWATQAFKTQIANVLGDDGLWPESVSTYHFYALDGFLALTEAAMNAGDDLYTWQAKPGKSLEVMFTAPLRYAYPNLRLAAINDGWYDAYLPKDQYALAYHRYHLPEFAWVVEQLQRSGHSWVLADKLDHHYRSLLYGEPLPPNPPKPSLASHDFPGLGIAILRQGSDRPPDHEMMLTFHYGPFRGHGHPDKMSVTLFAQGKLLASDYGTTGYGSQLSRFLQSTPAHNTLVVDGKSQPPTKERDLIAFKDTPEFKLAAARTTQVVPGTTWTRTVMLADQYAVVWDQLDGAAEHQYDWFFHAEGDGLSLTNASGSCGTTNLAEGEFPYGFITGVNRRRLTGSSVVAQWRLGGEGLDLCFLNRPGQTAFTAQYPIPEAKQVPLLVLRQKSRQAEFLAVLWPRKGAGQSALDKVQLRREAEGSLLVTIPVGERTDRLGLNATGVIYQQSGEQPLSIVLPSKDK